MLVDKTIGIELSTLRISRRMASSAAASANGPDAAILAWNVIVGR